jgi:NADH-quinone oxidoreductase subunit C
MKFSNSNLVILFNNFYSIRVLSSLFPSQILSIELNFKNIICNVKASSISFLVLVLKKSMIFKFTTLSDMWAVDFPHHRIGRFVVSYRLSSSFKFSFRYSNVLTLNVIDIKQSSPALPSISSIFKSSGWLEREIWDMYGIYFYGNSDLRRILTDYGFDGFPLRKDFPVTGYLALRYDFESKKTVLEPLDFSFGQEYRYFDFQNPWRYK